MGNGSPPTDSSTFTVVANQEQVPADKVHVLGFREGEGFSNEAGEALANSVVKAQDALNTLLQSLQ